MRAHFLLMFFFSNNSFSIFTSQNTSQKFSSSLCRPLSEGGRAKNLISFKISNLFFNLIFKNCNTISLFIHHYQRYHPCIRTGGAVSETCNHLLSCNKSLIQMIIMCPMKTLLYSIRNQ